MSSNPNQSAPNQSSGHGLDRPAWMGLLARTPRGALEEAWRRLPDPPAWRWLRRPETGLVMVRGRIGGDGRPYNLGEMTVTRCSLVIGEGRSGHGFVAGRDRRHAELAAVFDALLQMPAHAAALQRDLLPRLAAGLEETRRRRATRTAGTKVEFFTLVRGEDEP